MGIDYSLCAIVPRARAAQIPRGLAKRLDANGKRRLSNFEWTPGANGSSGFMGLALTENERENDYCFSLQAKLEHEMTVHLQDHGLKCIGREGSFGCLWTAVFVGSEHVLLKMTAATSGMSRVLQESQAIHKLWSGFCKDVNATVGYVELEMQTGLMLFPRLSEMLLPEDNESLELDHVIAGLLKANQSKL